MRVKQIASIKDFGIFSDYRGEKVKEFGIHNVIFGWNYSGKTTLSRIFRSLEERKPHPNFKGGKFKLILNDDSEITDENILSNTFRIRVFNTEYVRDNLSWEKPADNGAKPCVGPRSSVRN